MLLNNEQGQINVMFWSHFKQYFYVKIVGYVLPKVSKTTLALIGTLV